MQDRFHHECKSLIAVFREYGNPFLEESPDLLVLDTKEIMPDHVVAAVRNIESLGQEQYSTFVEERLTTCTRPLTDTISKNKLPLLKTAPQKRLPYRKMQLNALKSDMLYVKREMEI